MPIIPYLKSILGAALLAALAVIFMQHRTLENRNLQITILQSEIDDAEDLVNIQNERVDALTAKRDADRKAYNEGICKAARQVAAASGGAARILAIPAPEPADRCETAEAILRGDLR